MIVPIVDGFYRVVRSMCGSLTDPDALIMLTFFRTLLPSLLLESYPYPFKKNPRPTSSTIFLSFLAKKVMYL